MAAKRGTTSRAKSRMSTPATVDEYVAAVPEPARNAIAKMRTAIRSVLPAQAVETISYGMPAFKLKRLLVWYGAFQNHCSLFPKATVLEAFKDELKGYTISKGTVQFPIAKPLPTALIKELVKARLREEEEG